MITQKKTHCVNCENILTGKQTKFCCSVCGQRWHTKQKWIARRQIHHCVVCKNPLSGRQTKYCCKKCKGADHYDTNQSYTSLRKRALKRKQQLVDLLGGKCKLCGYSKCLRALCFHHKDPKTKKFALDSRRIAGTRWSSVILEAKKCELLCSNCHMELHDQENN